MTAFNIWRINRSNKILKNKYNDNSIRFCLYLKLSLVMGINWIFETLTMPTWLQFVAALYNGLTGVAIFFIFVVKWSIIEKVCNRLHIKSELVEKMRRRSSAATTTTSQGRKKSSIEDTTITDISTAKDSKRKSLNETIALSTVDE
ncbi:uncharacterized protein LOC113236038 [Hyposmocoma kahamanoa]|uniref:uncharacterized protein LOC113236038 n=1 Tax=Hyposmocoma kahamanoa TaxID=1477025 RepID=UPI000E6DA117|nr:uncharacterized protein LOC113236038 [Hyposmocoma kahamanoa]